MSSEAGDVTGAQNILRWEYIFFFVVVNWRACNHLPNLMYWRVVSLLAYHLRTYYTTLTHCASYMYELILFVEDMLKLGLQWNMKPNLYHNILLWKLWLLYLYVLIIRFVLFGIIIYHLKLIWSI